MHESIERYVQFAIRVWNVNPIGKSDEEVALEGIECVRAFWNSLGAPSTLADYGIDETTIAAIADKAMIRGEFGNFKKLNREDVIAILQASL